MICHSGWLRETMACAMRHTADFVAPLRLDPNGSVWAFAPELVRTESETVLEIARWFHDLPPATVQSIFGENDIVTNFISGGAGLFSRAAFQACGGFDEGYLAGFEDMDLSLKLAACGYTVWATTRAVLTHDDEWLPQTPADVEYARARYDKDLLRAAADRFQARWGVQVLPTKYVQSFQERLERKLANGR
jgi:GT2 family glycosyltransferase